MRGAPAKVRLEYLKLYLCVCASLSTFFQGSGPLSGDILSSRVDLQLRELGSSHESCFSHDDVRQTTARQHLVVVLSARVF